MFSFKIYITINGCTGSFVFFDEQSELVIDNEKDAIEAFNKQKRELLQHSCQDDCGWVHLHFDKCVPGTIAFFDEVRFLLTARLKVVLKQSGIID